MAARRAPRGLWIDGTLECVSGNTRVDVIGTGSELRVNVRGAGSIRWTPRLAWSLAALYVRVRRRIAPTRLRVRAVRSDP